MRPLIQISKWRGLVKATPMNFICPCIDTANMVRAKFTVCDITAAVVDPVQSSMIRIVIGAVHYKYLWGYYFD